MILNDSRIALNVNDTILIVLRNFWMTLTIGLHNLYDLKIINVSTTSWRSFIIFK